MNIHLQYPFLTRDGKIEVDIKCKCK